MIKQILLLVGVIFLITGCNGKDLQRSANNKLFDTKGFDKSKRKPIYNDKYIDRAKRNIVENNYEDDEIDIDEPDEYADPYTQNRIMYSNMVKNDKSKKRRNGNNRESYPDIGHARDLARSEDKSDSNSDLRKELDEIKNMLSSAKKDLSKYKCPLQTTDSAEVPKPKKPVKKALPPKAPVKQVEEESTYDDSDDIDTNADHASIVEPVVNHPAPLHPDQASAPNSAAVHAVSEPVIQSPSPGLSSGQQVPVEAPSVAPATHQPLSHHKETVPSSNYHEVADDVSNNVSTNPIAIVPSAQGSEHSMINLAPAK